MRNYLSKKKHGFTIIELLIVISIIGVLATVITYSFDNAKKKARDYKRKTDLSAIQTALELYYLQNKRYPGIYTGSHMIANPSYAAQPWIGDNFDQYISKIPTDPINCSGCASSGGHFYIYYAWDVGSAKGAQDYVIMTNLENNKDQSRRIFNCSGGCTLTSSPCDENPYYVYWGSYSNWPTYDYCASFSHTS